MKKFFALLIGVCLCCFVLGCGKKEEASTAGPTGDQAGKAAAMTGEKQAKETEEKAKEEAKEEKEKEGAKEEKGE